VAGLGYSLTWANAGGKACGGDAKLGIYAHYTPSCFFVDAILSGGWHWTSARRSILFNAIDSFAGLSRCAYSNQNGHDFEVHVQSGFDLGNQDWSLTPLARLSYFSNKQKQFQEYGANSLNLIVNGFKAGTLRPYIGAEFSRSFKTAHTSVVPNIHAAWARDVALDNRSITARLQDLNGCFTVNGLCIAGDRAIVGAGINVLCDNDITIFGRYDAELRENFIANTFKLGLTITF
jgi:outer membrane autotransporter protein